MKGYEKVGFVFAMRRSRVEFVGEKMRHVRVSNEADGFEEVYVE